MTVRVLLADDHPPTRAGVRWTLERAGMEVCAEVGDAAAAVEAAEAHRPDVCLLDINMPGGGGIEATRAITARLPETAVVILTVSRDDADLLEALRAGAAGYLLKDIEPKRMPAAIESVLAGEVSLPRTLVRPLLDDDGRPPPRRRTLVARGRPSELTPREWEVLDLLAAGTTGVEVAKRLELSPATVRAHVAGIVRKLGVAGRDEAIEVARRRPRP